LTHRHHYIPEWFQKLFATSGFFVYNKETERISKKVQYPGSLFYELNRNSALNKGETTDVIETGLFSYVYNLYANVVGKIVRKDLEQINDRDTLDLICFANSIRLRNPAMDVYLQELFSKYDFSDLGYSVVDTIANRKISKSELPYIDDPLFLKSQQVLAMFAPILKDAEYMKDILNSTVVLQSKYEKCLLADNPIVFKSLDTDITKIENFVFSISPKYTIVNIRSSRIRKFETADMLIKDTLLVSRARKYVCCSDRDYLEKAVSFCGHISEEELVDSLFS